MQGRRHGFLSGGQIVGGVASLPQNTLKKIVKKTPHLGRISLSNLGRRPLLIYHCGAGLEKCVPRWGDQALGALTEKGPKRQKGHKVYLCKNSKLPKNSTMSKGRI